MSTETGEHQNITLVLHDWGSGLGFHYAARNPDNIKAIAFMEAVVNPMKWSEVPKEHKLPFKLFRAIHLGEGLHYLQEDHPHAIRRGIANWYQGLAH